MFYKPKCTKNNKSTKEKQDIWLSTGSISAYFSAPVKIGHAFTKFMKGYLQVDTDISKRFYF